jgi:hypothetical protein
MLTTVASGTTVAHRAFGTVIESICDGEEGTTAEEHANDMHDLLVTHGGCVG